jgi:hypothetical protein
VPHPVIDLAALLTTTGVVVEALREERHLHRMRTRRAIVYHAWECLARNPLCSLSTGNAWCRGRRIQRWTRA